MVVTQGGYLYYLIAFKALPSLGLGDLNENMFLSPIPKRVSSAHK